MQVFGLATLVYQQTGSALWQSLGDAYVLGRSMMSVAGSGMQIVGMALGGVLVGLTSPRHALLVTACTCLCSAALVRFGLRARAGSGRRAPGRGAGLIGATWAGNR